jgi:hypothetical protein
MHWIPYLLPTEKLGLKPPDKKVNVQNYRKKRKVLILATKKLIALRNNEKALQYLGKYERLEHKVTIKFCLTDV